MHIEVAHAAGHLRDVAELVTPALLYADRVTIYSPAAWMLRSIEDFTDLPDRRQRFAAILEIVRQAPQLAPDFPQLDAATIAQLDSLLALNPRQLRTAARLMGGQAEMTELLRFLDDFDRMWDVEFSEVIGTLWDTMGSPELAAAVKAGVVEVADVLPTSSTNVVASSVRAALGASGEDDAQQLDDLVNGFVERIVNMVTTSTSFPLLDAQSSGLLQALHDEVGIELSTSAMGRGAEVKAAAGFMGYLPYFPQLPLDEVLGLREELHSPLIRFRAAMVSLAAKFEHDILDEDFGTDIEDAWREHVAPALAEIRELLAEHGFLKEIRSIALGDPKRLMLEAGGVFAAAKTDVFSLSGLTAAVAAGAVPAVDLAGRTIKAVTEARRDARAHGFYFLHRVATEADRKQRR